MSRPRRAAARSRTSATGIPSRSATSSGPAAPDRPGADEGPFEGGRLAHDGLERGAAPGRRPPGPPTGSVAPWRPGRASRDRRRDRRAPRRQEVGGAWSEPPRRLRSAPNVAPSRRDAPRRGPRATAGGGVARASVVTRRAVAASRVTTKATPSRSGQRAATNSRKSSSTVSVTRPVSHRGAGANRPVQGQRSAAAPSSASSWLSSLAGSNSPVTSQMTRWATLTAWSAKRS